jgi:putative PIN family toxin of toxin-antitoxin system
MRIAVFDTNVIVSAGLKPRSTPAELVDRLLKGQVQLVTCPAVIAEYVEVATRSKFARYGFPPEWLKRMIDESLQLPDPAPWPYELPDPKDAIFLALAKAAGAWLVSGNLKHFPASARHGVVVISPGEYLGSLGE